MKSNLRFKRAFDWRVGSLCVAMIFLAALGYTMMIWDTMPRPGVLKDKHEYAKYFEDFIVKDSAQAEEFATIAQNQCNFYKYDNPVDLGARDKIDETCYLGYSGRSVLILGDSTSADLYYGLRETLPKNISVRENYTHRFWFFVIGRFSVACGSVKTSGGHQNNAGKVVAW